MKKIKRFFRNIMIGLAFGMKKADLELLATKTQSLEGEGIASEVQIGQDSVMKDLKEGRITQEVRQLRYSMYLNAIEASKRKVTEVELDDYTGAFDAKTAKKYKRRIKGENTQDIEIGFVNNLTIGENTSSSFEKVDKTTGKEITSNRESKTLISIERDSLPKFLIENYVERLLVRKVKDTDEKLIDLFISKYPNPNKSQTITLTKDLEKLNKGEKPSNKLKYLEFNELTFETRDCFGIDDHYTLTYEILGFDSIREENGCYILRYKAMLIDVIDFMSEIYEESQAEKYRNNEARENRVRDLSGAFIDEEPEAGSLLEYLKNENKK